MKQKLHVEGPKLNNTLQERVSDVRGPDYRLQFTVVSPQPQLDIQFSPLPTDLLCGEVQTARATFHNRGQIPVHSVLVSSEDAKHFAFGAAADSVSDQPVQVISGNNFTPQSVAEVFTLALPSGVLNPGMLSLIEASNSY